MKALITGITGMHNRGVEAFLVPTIEQLRQRNPEIEISILTPTPDYDELRLQHYGVKLQLEGKHLQTSPPSRKQRLLAKLLPLYKLPKPSLTSPIISNASVVIASGGDVFSPEYDISPHLKPLRLALEANVPVLFLAQSISPYKTDEEAESWLKVARHSRLVTVREKLTYEYVTKVLGLSTELVKLTADPAFILPVPSIEQVDGMLKAYGIFGERPVVAISTSQGICSYASGLDYDKHLKSWKQVVLMLLNEIGAEVLIVPHVQKPKPSSDDRILATKLLRALNYDPRVHIAGADHTASEFKGLISACDLVIAERIHAAIAGLSSGVCTVAVGYSVKAEGIMADFFSSELLQEGLLIPIKDFMNPDVACQTIRTSWERRHEISSHIKEALTSVKDRAYSNFDMLLKAIE